MQTLSAKLNESITELHSENIDYLTEEIEMLCIDYFTDNTDTFEIETSHTDKVIKRKLTFLNNLSNFDSFKEAVNSTVNDFNKKMQAKGQNELNATWIENKNGKILELLLITQLVSPSI